jgi:hypothetical protein
MKMKNINLIKEEYIHIADSPELLDLINTHTPYFNAGGDKEFFKKYPYTFVSYLDLNPKRLIYCLVRKEKNCRRAQNLPELLNSQNPNNFHEILYVSTFYQPLEYESSAIFSSPFSICKAPEDEFLDSILSESRRYLAYNHQIEMLYRMITGCTPLKAINFRKGLFKRAGSFWEDAEFLRFPNGKTFKDVMDERMFDCFTTAPNFHGAMNLYECCFK